MISVTVEEIASALGAELSGPGDEAAVVTALTVDSRIGGSRRPIRRAARRACRRS